MCDLNESWAPFLAFTSVLFAFTSLNRAKFEEAYWGERRGRTRVEAEMRRITKLQLNTQNGFFVQPVGHIESCYRQCIGTPRQGLLVPASRASVVLASNMSPESMDGLEEFSHVWLSFQFHLNTNTLKEARAFKGVISNGGGNGNASASASSCIDMQNQNQNQNQHKRAYTFSGSEE